MTGLLAQLELTRPAWLAALLVVALVALSSRGAADVPRWRRWAEVACRCLLLALLIVALCRPVWHRRHAIRSVVFAVDVSASIDPDAARQAQAFIDEALKHQGAHDAAVLAFADRPGPVGEKLAIPPELNTEASDPGAATLAAAGSIAADRVGEVVLLADGAETAGRLLAAARGCGVRVSVVPLPGRMQPDVCLLALRTSAPPHRGRQPLEVVIRSDHTGDGKLRLSVENEDVLATPIHVEPGDTPVAVDVAAPRERDVVVRAELVDFDDSVAQNNARSLWLGVTPPPRALLVAASSPLRQQIDAALSADFDVATTTPNELAADPQRLADCDLLILAEADTAALTDGTFTAIDPFVRQDGGGLLVVGAEATFEAERYAQSPLEQLLPVRPVERAVQQESSLALVLVVDKSKSMRQQRRLDLAKEAARRTVALLAPTDHVGVLAFGSVSQWVSDVAPCRDKDELLQRIDGLQAEGLTNMAPALQKARLALMQTHADRRHVILLTDGVSSPGDFGRIARDMAAAGITVSTVSVGAGADQTILRDIARIAQGQHYHCADPAEIPGVLEKETRSAVAAAAGKQFRPFVLRQLPGLDVATAPPLTDYTPTGPKDGAELLLMAREGDPLLCWWRVGQGTAAAFTSSAAAWQDWPQADAFWLRLARHVARGPQPPRAAVNVRRAGDRAIVELTATDRDGQWLDRASPRLTSPFATAMIQVAPGTYQAEIDVGQSDDCELAIRYDEGQATRHLARRIRFDYAAEWIPQPAAETLLRRVAEATGGTFAPTPEQVFAPDARTAPERVPLWPYLVLAAALLLVIDVALRRHDLLRGRRRAKRGQVPFAGTARRVLRTKGT